MIVFFPFRDCIWNALCNSGTSVYGGFLIFSILGFMAKHEGVEVKDVVQAGSFAHDLKKMVWVAMVEFKNAKTYNIPEKERSRFHLRCTFVSVQCPGPVFSWRTFIWWTDVTKYDRFNVSIFQFHSSQLSKQKMNIKSAEAIELRVFNLWRTRTVFKALTRASLEIR